VLKVSQENWCYMDWVARRATPKTLTSSELPELNSLSAHFAMEVDSDVDAPVSDRLDAAICSSALESATMVLV
jgi:hypothetical protein